MCAICNLLDQTFPPPKALARAYFEATLSGVPERHPAEVEAKMDELIQDQGLTSTELEAYATEYNEEIKRLKDL